MILSNNRVENTIPFTKAAAEAEVLEVKKRIEEFEAVCDYHFKEARLEQVLKRGATTGNPVNPGDLVMYRKHKRNKFSRKWYGPATVVDVFDSMVRLEGSKAPVALEHVKKYTGPPSTEELLGADPLEEWVPKDLLPSEFEDTEPEDDLEDESAPPPEPAKLEKVCKKRRVTIIDEPTEAVTREMLGTTAIEEPTEVVTRTASGRKVKRPRRLDDEDETRPTAYRRGNLRSPAPRRTRTGLSEREKEGGGHIDTGNLSRK